MSHTIYVNDDSRKKLQSYYEIYLKSFNVQFEREYVETRYGKTHILVTGPKEGKPLFIFQGGNCINPMTLSWFSDLLSEYRVYSPDTIGHPGYSSETRISAKDNSFALWILDLMDHFQIEKAAFAGPSYGGGIILRLATYFPERIACSILYAPAGILLGSKIEMIRKILIPLLSLKMTGNKKYMKKIADAMSDYCMKDMDADIIMEIFRSTKLEQEMPKLTTASELNKYSAPTMIIGGKKDIFFPGERMIETAKKIIPNITASHFYDMGHFASEEMLKKINRDMISFIKTYY
ncbi:alpha/beta fold hydrolase [Bacillus sp. CGMCC 1.16607]|uniref:alpha/beta fold hydrolase n=1 Tax=Bacillus sp. CGMCC 1.16607 TaxID=3351842 RepID=UPI003637826C